MTQDSLLPCPFCGGAAIQEDLQLAIGGEGEPYWLISCSDCGIPSSEGCDEREAIAAWNRRAPDAALEALEEIRKVRVPSMRADAQLNAIDRIVGTALSLYRQRSKT